jgi:glycosyltransferase involved in cell wall biosynthesis
LVCADIIHIEMAAWKRGGFPRIAVDNQDFLDLNIVTTRHLKDWMVAQGADSTRVEVCYSNVDADDWRPDAAERADARAELGLAEDEATPVILYAARICEQKQPRVFAETIRTLAAEGLAFKAIVVGDGPDLPDLKAHANACGLESLVLFRGSVSSVELKRTMRASDIFFLPSE